MYGSRLALDIPGLSDTDCKFGIFNSFERVDQSQPRVGTISWETIATYIHYCVFYGPIWNIMLAMPVPL